MRDTMCRAGALTLVIAILVPAAAGIASGDVVKDRIAAFKKTMKKGEERERINAVNALAKLPHKSVNRELRKVVGGDRSERVQAAAAVALAQLGNPKDLSFLMGAVRGLKKKPLALAGVVDAIGEYRHPKSADVAYDVARKWLTKHKYPAMAGIRALGKIPSRKSVEYLIKVFDLTYPRSAADGFDDGVTYHPPTTTSDETLARLSDYRPYVVKGRISRPTEDWRWAEKPEKGFNRTADLKPDGGQIAARLSIMTYSVWVRTPNTAAEMATKQKDFLEKEFAFVKEKRWDEKVRMGKTDDQPGVEALRQTIAGTWGEKNARVTQTIFVRQGIMYVIRLTAFPGLSNRGEREARDFVDSFRFLL
jgi:hypothetical protein